MTSDSLRISRRIEAAIQAIVFLLIATPLLASQTESKTDRSMHIDAFDPDALRTREIAK